MAHTRVQVRPFDEFQSSPLELVRQVRSSGEPLYLSVDDGSPVVMQDAVTYRRLLERIETAKTVAGIDRGLEQARRG